MTTYTLDTLVDRNTPRVLWRNTVLDEQPGTTYTVFVDPTTWRTGVVPAESVLTLERPIACNAIGIARGDWSGQIIAIDYDDDGGGWVQAGIWQPRAGAPFLGLFDFQTAPAWRLRVVSGVVSASVIRIGMALAMQRNLYSGFAPITKRVNKTPNMQLGAHFSGSQIRQTRRETGKLNFNNLTPDWVRAYWSEFMRDSRSLSAFVAWRPGDYPNETVYGMTGDDIKATNEMGNGMMQTSFEIEGCEK